jgi:hypothetical protein
MATQAAERIGPAKHVSERLDTGSIVLTRFAVVRRERMAAW